MGIFDEHFREEKITKLGNQLETINRIIDWEQFRPVMQKLRSNNPNNIKGAGRKPYDEIMMLKILILQRLYNLSDDQMEYQLNDRRSFSKFVGITDSNIPDAKTIWLYREKLKELGLAEELFNTFKKMLWKQGYGTRTGMIVDASITKAEIQRNTREENKQIKEGDVPDDWSEDKKCQKDTDATWVKKDNKTYFGYKNNVIVSSSDKYILAYRTTTASCHDVNSILYLLGKVNKCKGKVYADKGYVGVEGWVTALGHRNMILEKGRLSSEQEIKNKKKSRTRCRVEHVFGDIKRMGGDMIRSIGMKRADTILGLVNLTYNMRRYVYHVKQSQCALN